MPVMLSLSNGRMLPASELEALRNVARSNQSDVLFVGNRSFRLHHISFMDGFSVEPIPGGFLECIGRRSQRQLADSLERQLNGGNSFFAGVQSVYGANSLSFILAGKCQK